MKPYSDDLDSVASDYLYKFELNILVNSEMMCNDGWLGDLHATVNLATQTRNVMCLRTYQYQYTLFELVHHLQDNGTLKCKPISSVKVTLAHGGHPTYVSGQCSTSRKLHSVLPVILFIGFFRYELIAVIVSKRRSQITSEWLANYQFNI